MDILPDDLVAFLGTYKYLVIFPVVVVEGPIITVVSGFLAKLGVLNGFLAYTILLLGDIIGDCLFYTIGKYSRTISWAKKVTNFLGYDEQKEKFLQNHFERHTYKTFLLAKFSNSLGSSVQVAAGMSSFSFKRFFTANMLGAIPKTLILFLIGYYLGESYVQINEYLNSFALIGILIAIFFTAYFWVGKYVSRVFFTKENAD